MNAPVRPPSLPALDPNFDRRSGVGASEVAAILGLDPRRTPLALWLDKTGQRPPFEGNEWTRMGHRLEAVIADAYAEREGVELATCTTKRHPHFPHVFATPDRRVVGVNRLIECKAVFSPRVMLEFGEDGSSDYPERYGVQAMVQAAVEDADDVVIAALMGAELRAYRVPRDRTRERRILELVEAWWERHITRGEQPPMDGSEAASEWLKSQFPRDNGDLLEADATTAVLIREVIETRESAKLAEERFEISKQNLQQVIGDASGIKADGVGKVSWKRANGVLKTDWQAIATELGADDALVSKHSRSVPGSRRFLVTAEKSL